MNTGNPLIDAALEDYRRILTGEMVPPGPRPLSEQERYEHMIWERQYQARQREIVRVRDEGRAKVARMEAERKKALDAAQRQRAEAQEAEWKEEARREYLAANGLPARFDEWWRGEYISRLDERMQAIEAKARRSTAGSEF